MRIANATTDQVNQTFAAQMAAKCGAIICHLRPGEVHPNGLFRESLPRERLRGHRGPAPLATLSTVRRAISQPR